MSEPAVFMTARRLRLPLFLLGAMLAFAPMALSTNARANVFTDVQAAVADVLESDNETGGYAVGLLAIIVILLIVIVFMGAVKSENPLFLSVAALAGVAFVTLVGWWPWWSVMFIFVLGVLSVVLGRGGGSSE